MTASDPIERPRRRRGGWLALAALAACRPAPDPFRLPAGTPVVVVCVDTLRADRLGTYGYPLGTSPALDRFAESAYVFEEASTQCNATLPSITSILTGLFVRSHRNYISVPVEGLVRDDDTVTALPERLQRAGYATMATISHPSWRAAPDSPGFSRGWDALTIIPDGIPIELRPLAATGHYTNERAFAALDHWRRANERRAQARREGVKGAEAEKPPFLFVHYFDPHSDLEHNLYNPPPAFWNFTLRHHLREAGLEHLYEQLAPLAPMERQNWLVTHPIKEERRPVSLAVGRALYDGEVRYVDWEIERLFDRLKVLGLYDDALIVVMADHGENMEDDNTFYGSIAFSHKRLREGVARTPLFVRLPGQTEGVRVPALVQNIDVYPTILELLGLPADPDAEGKSLVPLLRDGGASVHEKVFVESSDHVERAIKTDELKYVDPGHGADALLFRWRQDPEELTDVSGEVPAATMESFARAMDEFRPREALRLRFAPDAAPYRVELALEVVDSEIVAALGADARSAAATIVIGPDARTLQVAAEVGAEAIEVLVSTKRRNAESRWRLSVSAHDGTPVGADALAERVFLGPFPVERSHAQPMWRASEAPAPERPLFSWDTRAEGAELALAFDGGDDAPHRFELEGRYVAPSYDKDLPLVAGMGLAPEGEDDVVVHRFAGHGVRADAVLGRPPRHGEVRFLARIDGAWPPCSRVALDGFAARCDELAFALPFPLDPRITTLLLGKPPAELPPGAITIRIDTRLDGAFEIDTSGMSAAQIEQLRVLGYVR